METKETFTRGGIRDETVALLYMLHHLIATHSSLLPKLRQVSKLALSSKPSKDLLKGFVGRCCPDVIACRPSSQSEILKASTVLQMYCRDKKERMGIVEMLSVSLVSTLSSMAICARMPWKLIRYWSGSWARLCDRQGTTL